MHSHSYDYYCYHPQFTEEEIGVCTGKVTYKVTQLVGQGLLYSVCLVPKSGVQAVTTHLSTEQGPWLRFKGRPLEGLLSGLRPWGRSGGPPGVGKDRQGLCQPLSLRDSPNTKSPLMHREGTELGRAPAPGPSLAHPPPRHVPGHTPSLSLRRETSVGWGLVTTPRLAKAHRPLSVCSLQACGPAVCRTRVHQCTFAAVSVTHTPTSTHALTGLNLAVPGAEDRGTLAGCRRGQWEGPSGPLPWLGGQETGET